MEGTGTPRETNGEQGTAAWVFGEQLQTPDAVGGGSSEITNPAVARQMEDGETVENVQHGAIQMGDGGTVNTVYRGAVQMGDGPAPRYVKAGEAAPVQDAGTQWTERGPEVTNTRSSQQGVRSVGHVGVGSVVSDAEGNVHVGEGVTSMNRVGDTVIVEGSDGSTTYAGPEGVVMYEGAGGADDDGPAQRYKYQPQARPERTPRQAQQQPEGKDSGVKKPETLPPTQPRDVAAAPAEPTQVVEQAEPTPRPTSLFAGSDNMLRQTALEQLLGDDDF
jgi:hypothetical protein